MKKKKTLILSSLLATTTLVGATSYYMISKKIFNDILIAKNVSKASDHTDYGPLNIKLAKSRAWFRKQPYITINVTSFDGLKLQGYTLSNTGSNKWVILVHGYKSSISSMLYAAKTFYDDGYNILLIDQRSHGDSEGTYIGMGWLEQHDLKLWIEKVIELDNQAAIALYGVSMGGTTVMMTTGLDLPPNVKCAIEDCGYSSLDAIFKDQSIKKYNIHDTRVFIGLYKIIKRKLGFNVHEASALDQLKKSKTPTLFIHGDDDKFVPYEMVYKNIDACNSDKELFIAPSLGHSLACLDERYFSVIFNFINKHM